MRINDGYTEVATRNGMLIEFRPMLHAERTAVLATAMAMPRENRRYFLHRHMQEHVINGPTFRLMDGDDFKWAFQEIVGHGTRTQEHIDARNLYEGTRLKLLYPHINANTCAYCKVWWFDAATGETFQQDGKPLRRTEEELLCQVPAGCPNGTPENQRTLSEKNLRAFQFDLHCRAVGQWPDDSIVKRNAYLIGMAAKRVQRDRDERDRSIRRFSGSAGRPGVDDRGNDFG